MIRINLKFSRTEAKKCSHCRKTKFAKDFYQGASYSCGLSSVCRECNPEACRSRMQRNKEKYRHRDRVNKRIKHYGLSEKDYNDLLEKQDHCCAICSKKPEGNLFVDHNHKTNKVRGLLCTTCNTGIGLLRDRPALLRKAARYLEIHDGWTIRRLQA